MITQSAISGQSFGTSTNIGNNKFSINPLTFGASTLAYIVSAKWTNGTGLVDRTQQLRIWYATTDQVLTAAQAPTVLAQAARYVDLRPDPNTGGIVVKRSLFEDLTGPYFHCWVDAPTLTNAATLDVVLIELAVSLTASGAAVTPTNPLPVAGEMLSIVDSTVVTAALYASGNCIGGKRTLANAVLVSGGSAFLHHIHIVDRSNTKPSGKILVFNANPAAATTTDKTAFVYSTDDFKEIAVIPVSASDYTTINSKATADLINLGRLVKASTGTTLYAVFVSDGVSVPTFAATTDLQLTWNFVPNSN